MSKHIKVSLTMKEAEMLEWAAGNFQDDMATPEERSRTKRDAKAYFNAMEKLRAAIMYRRV